MNHFNQELYTKWKIASENVRDMIIAQTVFGVNTDTTQGKVSIPPDVWNANRITDRLKSIGWNISVKKMPRSVRCIVSANHDDGRRFETPPMPEIDGIRLIAVMAMDK